MPIYQYRCVKCDHEIEVLQSIHQSPLTECPTCHQASLEKCITAASVRFSGKGYYETDEKPKSKQRNVCSEASSANDTTSPCNILEPV